jgi:copper(I)-binding protein
MSPVSEKSGKLMTGSFMTIANTGAEDVTLTGGTSPLAGFIEIHEVVDGAMQPLSGGLVIPAGGSVKLKMGGYHVMLMDLEEPLASGTEVPITLDFSNGEQIDIVAPSREIAMDDEQYGPDSQ